MFLFFSDDVGDQLCERVLGVLYEIWLIACVKSFPNPTLWKTFREMCMNWRHRTGITQALFSVHDFLIRIRIRGSVPLDYGSRSCYFLQWLSRCQQKTSFLLITVPVINKSKYL
jgi:hypothetical protein